MRYALVAVMVAGALGMGCATSSLSPAPQTAGDVGTAQLTSAAVRVRSDVRAVERPDTQIFQPELQTWGAADDDEDYGF